MSSGEYNKCFLFLVLVAVALSLSQPESLLLQSHPGVSSSSFSKTAQSVLATSTRWKLDDFYLGQPLDELSVPTEMTPLGWHEYTNKPEKFFGATRVEVAPGFGVVNCSGGTLSLSGVSMLQNGNSLSKVRSVLGEPDRTGGLMGYCRQDPFLRWYYFRGDVVISLIVSNDEFIQNQYPNTPKEALEPYRSKVHEISLSRSDYRELFRFQLGAACATKTVLDPLTL